MSNNPSEPEKNLYAGNPPPVAPQENVSALTTLLGIGLLGALLISIWVFGGFTPNMQTKLLSSPKGFDFRLYSTMSLLFEGKMIALISIAFGAGMVLFLKKPNDAGKPSRADLFIRRQFWLLVLGVLNAVIFLWSQDVLFHLGIMGILLFAFFRASYRSLLIASVLTTIIFSAKHYWNYDDNKVAYKKYLAVVAAEKKIKEDSISNAAKKDTAATKAAIKKDTLTKDQKADKGAWEGIVASVKYDAKKDESSIKAMRKHDYEKLYDHLLPLTQSKEAQWTYKFGIWDLASMMFLGMALLGYGFFSGRLSTLQYLVLAFVGIGAGLLLGWYRFYFQIESIRDYQKFVSRHALPFNIFFSFEQAFIALGYASGIMPFIKTGILKRLLSVFSCVGSIPLTNYFLQTFACTLFFTGFGMGYFGKLDQHQLYFVVTEIWILQIVFSVYWIRHFREGPVEWLWRCLTYGRWLPFRRRVQAAQESVAPA